MTMSGTGIRLLAGIKQITKSLAKSTSLDWTGETH
jgi:hypothetical protein